MPETRMWAYIWDFLEEGPEVCAKRLKEDLGVEGVSVATIYHSVEHWRLRGPSPSLYRSEGRVYFRLTEKTLEKSPLKPPLYTADPSSDPLEKVARACDKTGLRLVSWTVCLHNSEIGRRHPEAQMQNVFGIGYPTNLCPANPAVQEFLTLLLSDLTQRYPIAEVELESAGYGGIGHSHGHEKIAFTPGPLEHYLLSLCFCPHCFKAAQEAGLETSEIRAPVEQTLKQSFTEGRPHGVSVDEFLAQHPPLRRFQRVREKIVKEFLNNLKSASSAPLCFYDMGSRLESGAPIQEVADIVDKVMVLAYTPQTGVVETTLHHLAGLVGNKCKKALGLCIFPPATTREEEIRANALAGARAEVENINFYHYGIALEPHLEWTRKAIAEVKKG